MIPLINKQQIAKYMTLPEQIPNLLLDEFINDVQNFDIINSFPASLVLAIEINIALNIKQWNKNDTYAIGDKVWFENPLGKYYEAIISNINSQPPSDNWGTLELMDFYSAYLVPFMSYSFQYRFTAYHGIQTTTAGMVQATDPGGTFQPISDTDRSRKMGDVKNKLSVWTGKISKKLNEVNFTFDGVRYPQDSDKSTSIKRKARLYALGADRDKGCSRRNRLD